MKKLLSIMILVLVASVSFGQLGSPLTQKKADARYIKSSDAVLLRDSVYVQSQIDAKFESLFDGTYERNGYKYRIQRDSTIIPNHTGLLTGLVAGYKFDETSGTTAYNVVNGSPNGTISGDVTVNQTGMGGKYYAFGGTNGKVDLTNNSIFDFVGTSMSFFVWVKIANPGTYLQIFRRASYMDFRIDDSRNLNLTLAGATVNSSISVSSGTQHLIGFTFNYSNNEVKVYIDGVVSGTGTATTPLSSNSNVMQLGMTISSTLPFIGDMDQPLFYNVALDQTKITTLFNGGTVLPIELF